MPKKDKSELSQASASDIVGYNDFLREYMRAFAEAYPDEQIVQHVVGQIPWGHNVRILDAVKDLNERLWYAQQTIQHGWLPESLQGNLPTIEQLEAELETVSIEIETPQ